MVNLLKVIFLGIIGFSFLVYLTAKKPEKIENSDDIIKVIKYESMPENYELVGKKVIVSKDELLKKQSDSLIVVGSHDSLSVLNEFPKLFNLNIPYIMVANISSAPWFVKKMIIPSKLEEINKDSNIPMIYDFNGDTTHALFLNDSSKTGFFAYLLTKDGVITKIYDGKVKDGAIDGSMSKEEIKTTLEPLYKLVSKIGQK